ncbi:MAG: hypothetical protein L6V95_00945 [Candidatus Melainabacteria bacterium]|nr:MAG: hypothetical protein L6V95_00945 [Candidatus Melainabacteria bacterium]
MSIGELLNKSIDYIKVSKYQEALMLLNEANEIENDNLEVLKNIALCYVNLEENEKSFRVF